MEDKDKQIEKNPAGRPRVIDKADFASKTREYIDFCLQNNKIASKYEFMYKYNIKPSTYYDYKNKYAKEDVDWQDLFKLFEYGCRASCINNGSTMAIYTMKAIHKKFEKQEIQVSQEPVQLIYDIPDVIADE